MNKVSRCLVILLIAFYLPLQSMAWGMLGHRIVGEIADKYLTAKAHAEIKKILGNESVAMSSNWADFIKSDTTYRFLNPWHYVNFPKGMSYPEVENFFKQDTAVDAYTRLNFLMKELKNKLLPRDKKIYYLRLLIHIGEDISQPLHVSPIGTTGGNDIKLTWFNQPSNLHRVWDEDLIEYQQLSYTEYVKAINFATPAQVRSWQKGTLGSWMYESYVLAQELINDVPAQNAKLSYDYNFKHVAQLNHQLLKGGIRLAALLNRTFK